MGSNPTLAIILLNLWKINHKGGIEITIGANCIMKSRTTFLSLSYSIVQMDVKNKTLLIIARILIAIVLFLNIQAAVLFFVRPEAYIGGFGLEAAVGKPVVRGFGLLFLMWNIPYIFAFVNPLRHRISLIEAVIMQGLALAGESAILRMDASIAPAAQETIRRFILFDGGGLVILVAAFLICERLRKSYGGTTK